MRSSAGDRGLDLQRAESQSRQNVAHLLERRADRGRGAVAGDQRRASRRRSPPRRSRKAHSTALAGRQLERRPAARSRDRVRRRTGRPSGRRRAAAPPAVAGHAVAAEEGRAVAGERMERGAGRRPAPAKATPPANSPVRRVRARASVAARRRARSRSNRRGLLGQHAQDQPRVGEQREPPRRCRLGCVRRIRATFTGPRRGTNSADLLLEPVARVAERL